MTNEERIAALERELASLKAAAPAPPPDYEKLRKEADEWRDKMRQAEDARFRNFPHSPEMIRAYDAANGTAGRGDIAALTAAATPRSALTREDFERGRGRGRRANPPGDGKGIAREIPFGPQPGINYVDAQIDAQDARDKADRIAQEARAKAVLKGGLDA
jgi:hypothetical protein